MLSGLQRLPGQGVIRPWKIILARETVRARDAWLPQCIGSIYLGNLPLRFTAPKRGPRNSRWA